MQIDSAFSVEAQVNNETQSALFPEHLKEAIINNKAHVFFNVSCKNNKMEGEGALDNNSIN